MIFNKTDITYHYFAVWIWKVMADLLFLLWMSINASLTFTGFYFWATKGNRREEYRRKHYGIWHGRWKRALEDEHIRNIDLTSFLNGKCFDKAPNCNQELCQKHNISLWKKCQKTCGAWNPEMPMITKNPRKNKHQLVKIWWQSCT